MEQEDPQQELEKVHRQEKQELAEKVKVLRESASKSDKKKKKEINAEISRLEGDLNEKHSDELMELLLNGVTVSEEVEEKPAVEVKKPEEPEQGKEGRVSKAQKRRDNKVQKEEQRKLEILKQEEENLLGVRHREQERIKVTSGDDDDS